MSLLVNILAGSFYFLSCLLFTPGQSATAKKQAPQTHTVQIIQMKFVPAVLEVKKGDKIVFINKDMVVHNVTEQTGKSWKSPEIASDASWSMIATKNVSYFCSFHPVMKGKLLVK
jgi:plastocyanin